jgi:hypothetical protein
MDRRRISMDEWSILASEHMNRLPIAENVEFADLGTMKRAWHSHRTMSWAVHGVDDASPERPVSPQSVPEPYSALIRLARMHEAVPTPQSWDPRWLLEGSSDFVINGAAAQPRKFSATIYGRRYDGVTGFVLDDLGRAKAIEVYISAAHRLTDAYFVAMTMFNQISSAIALDYGLPLRQVAILVWTRNGRQVAYKFWAFPPTQAVSALSLAAVSLERFIALYTEAVQTNSPLYSFLCLYTLAEFLMNKAQHVFQRLAQSVGLPLSNLKGTLVSDDMMRVMPAYANMTYDEVLKTYRSFRNRVAHFSLENDFGPLNVKADDDAALAADVLKIACRDLLRKAALDVENLKKSGIAEARIHAELRKIRLKRRRS